jgi:hypothetical protein
MTPNVLAGGPGDVKQEIRAGIRPPVGMDALDPETISELPAARISQMSCDELVRVIQHAHLPFLSEETVEHLPFRDHQTLERLANLAQRCCFNRSTRPDSLVGQTTRARQTPDG